MAIAVVGYVVFSVLVISSSVAFLSRRDPLRVRVDGAAGLVIFLSWLLVPAALSLGLARFVDYEMAQIKVPTFSHQPGQPPTTNTTTTTTTPVTTAASLRGEHAGS